VDGSGSTPGQPLLSVSAGAGSAAGTRLVGCSACLQPTLGGLQTTFGRGEMRPRSLYEPFGGRYQLPRLRRVVARLMPHTAHSAGAAPAPRGRAVTVYGSWRRLMASLTSSIHCPASGRRVSSLPTASWAAASQPSRSLACNRVIAPTYRVSRVGWAMSIGEAASMALRISALSNAGVCDNSVSRKNCQHALEKRTLTGGTDTALAPLGNDCVRMTPSPLGRMTTRTVSVEVEPAGREHGLKRALGIV
jgi:hypothetical protein